MAHPLSFTARIITGSGRGKGLGVPTMNLRLEDVPGELEDGIYACTAKRTSDFGPDFARATPGKPRTSENKKWISAVMHVGARPVFHDTRSCEVHVIDANILNPPSTIAIAIIGFLRPIQDFPSIHALQQQMNQDIKNARAMLISHAQATQNPPS